MLDAHSVHEFGGKVLRVRGAAAITAKKNLSTVLEADADPRDDVIDNASGSCNRAANGLNMGGQFVIQPHGHRPLSGMTISNPFGLVVVVEALILNFQIAVQPPSTIMPCPVT
jgi:hypothetical protein